MARISDVYRSRNITAESLDGRPQGVSLTIASTTVKQYGTDKKIALGFVGTDRELPLNRTNAAVLSAALGDDSDRWPGHRVILRSVEVSYRGQPVRGVRVEIPGRASSTPPPAPREPPRDPRDGFARERVANSVQDRPADPFDDFDDVGDRDGDVPF